MKDNNKNIELQTDNLITEKFHELLAANTKKLNDLRLEYAQRMADAQDDYDEAVKGLLHPGWTRDKKGGMSDEEM